MRQTKFLFVMMLALVLSNAVVSCKKDPAPQEKKTVENPELATKLKALGFQVEGDVITIDDKVMNSTSLDLSGAGLSDLAGLEVFPKLEEVNLSNNNFGDTFDFAQLPKNVTSVNLADNDIYIYKGLATVSDEGFAVQKQLKKLVLPASARFNVELLPYYYKETKGKTTLQMQNPETKAIEDYTTLRNIPDETLRNFFKENFSSMMTEDGQVDLGKKLSGDDAQKQFVTLNINPKPENWEGIEYLLNRLEYETPGIGLLFDVNKPYKLKTPYLKINSKLQFFNLANLDVKNIDMSKAYNITRTYIINNPSIEIFDLSNSKKFMIGDAELTSNQETGSAINIAYCNNLKEIKISQEIKPTVGLSIEFVNLPNLTTFDMSKYIGLERFSLINLPKIEFDMPNIQQYTNKREVVYFAIDATMAENPKVKAFVIKYGKEKHLKRKRDVFWGSPGKRYHYGGNLMDFKIFNFTKLY